MNFKFNYQSMVGENTNKLDSKLSMCMQEVNFYAKKYRFLMILGHFENETRSKNSLSTRKMEQNIVFNKRCPPLSTVTGEKNGDIYFFGNMQCNSTCQSMTIERASERVENG